ncbi:18693_t:CDS:2, partial [Racocetra fulgida]
ATDVIGPTNMSSLDYNVPDDQCERPNIISDTSFLVEEPQELEIIESDTERSIMNREVFYTPSENIKSFPVTPPHKPHLFNSKKKTRPQSLPLNMQNLQQIVESPPEENNVLVPSTNSSISSINHDEINDRGFNVNNDDESIINSDSESFETPVCESGVVLKEDPLSDPCDYGMKVFIFRPKTYALSVEWYRALYNLLRPPSIKPVPLTCDVVVPDLNVRVRIPLEDGTQAFKITAEEITKTVLDELGGINEWEDVLNEWLKNGDMRLCWKRYDRIEWIVWEKNDSEKDRNDLLACPQFIEGEPPPVEGYLIRVTNDKGRKNKSKRLYFSSHDHYLFFMNPSFACPPPPPPSGSGSTEDEKLNTKRPIMYAVSPHIQGNDNAAAFIKADVKRRVKQILNAYGFINLIDAIEVRPLINDNNEDTCENDNLGDKSKERKYEGKGCPFELVMSNGMTIVLEWVKCLNALVKYWKARVADDIKIRISMFKENQFNDYDDDGAYIGDGFRGHWDSNKRHVIERHGTIGLELQKKAKLDSSGKAWIFRARNRLEREEWVWALNIEIERCLMEEN